MEKLSNDGRVDTGNENSVRQRQCHGAALWHMAIFVAAESLPALHGVALRLDEHTSPSFV